MKLRRGQLAAAAKADSNRYPAGTTLLGIGIAFRAVGEPQRNGRHQAQNAIQGLLEQIAMEEKLLRVCAQLDHSL
jgi:hypothetical protein